MQLKGVLKPDNPEQLIERISRVFVKQMHASGLLDKQANNAYQKLSLLNVIERKPDKQPFKVL